ncbi:hypothetical protein [Candidatus Nitronereus thalassa]|uniref:Uncharacterized protein n=1 Tax=Candidatus Nitronereus thalassa TaxID=3020898 RepID=A0ABU3K981_9BACT|nr:hypothetical protein [Candidatus Nitronereus thalassa]MDT7042922.1 hypothetical protein [Candidatus Nitronereus thalassa]
MPSILNQEDLIASRSPRELQSWIDEKISEFSKTPELKEQALLKKGLAKPFFEEILPLCQLAMNLYGNRKDVACIPNLDNDNYDATILDKSYTPPKELKVEFTRAVDGKDDYLRMKYFLEHGHVNLVGDLRYEGSEKRGHKIQVKDEAVSVNDTRKKTCELIRKCVEGKSNRQYGKSYMLVITFDDYIGFRFDDNETFPVLDKMLNEIVSGFNLDFEKLYLLGFSGKTILNCSIQ